MNPVYQVTIESWDIIDRNIGKHFNLNCDGHRITGGFDGLLKVIVARYTEFGSDQKNLQNDIFN